MNSHAVWDGVAENRRAGIDCVIVTTVATRGSVPGSSGNKALVTAKGLVAGNLGGGRVEARAIQEAQAMLSGEIEGPIAERDWNLQRDIGMTCGGEMRFLFESVPAASDWHIVVFGAGHVGQAVVPVLATLACRIVVVDVREDWLRKLPEAPNVSLQLTESFEDGVSFLRPESYLLCVTKGHKDDRPVLRKALLTYPNLPFFGVIGSKAKRAVLLRELCEDGLPEDTLSRLTCPLGLPVGGNDPAEIAISVAAQLLEHRG